MAMDELLNDFLVETADHIEVVESYLVRFEQNPGDTDAVTQIFRLLHSMKGTCGFLGLERLQGISHAAETLIDTLRNGAPPTAAAVSLLLRATDRIKHLLASVGASGTEPEGGDVDISGEIAAYIGETSRVPSEARGPSAGGAKPRQRSRKTKRAKEPETAALVLRDATGAPALEAKLEVTSLEASQSARGVENPSAKSKTPDTIRISVTTIQRIMELVSELVLTRNQIADMSRQQSLNQIKAPLERLSTVTSDLQDAVMQARMQPVSRLFERVPRLVRELSAELKKKFNLVIDGGDTELDRQLIEAIRDPLTHLIRNCADHGIDPPEERIKAGKAEAGEISIVAFHESGQVHIEISDDGRGLDTQRIREKAVQRGLVTADAATRLSDEDVYRFILEPGFSTAKSVTNVSGRGVGMDVVRANIEAIGGTISLQSSKGRGSKFILKIPLTLAIAPTLIVGISGHRFAIPQQYVVEVVSADEDADNLQTVQNALVLQLRRELVPVADLAALFELEQSNTNVEKLVVVLSFRGRKFGILVDDVAGIEEIVIQPMGSTFSALKLFSGNTILGDGSIILIIDPAAVAGALNVEPKSDVASVHKDEPAAGIGTSSYILFRAGSGAAKVLPRSAVLRIVQAKASAICRADGIYLCRYQNKLIPVIPAAGDCEICDSSQILILSFLEKTFGLCVDQVLDIVESSAQIQSAGGTPSVIGAVDLNGVAVELIDSGYFYRQAFNEAPRYSRSADLLLVESEHRMRDMLSPALVSAGDKVTAVHGVEQANSLLLRKDFSAILLDAPTRAGLDETALLRQRNGLCLIFDAGHEQAEGGSYGNNLVSRFDLPPHS